MDHSSLIKKIVHSFSFNPPNFFKRIDRLFLAKTHFRNFFYLLIPILTRLRVFLGPLSGFFLEFLGMFKEHLRDYCILRTIRCRCVHECLKRN